MGCAVTVGTKSTSKEPNSAKLSAMITLYDFGPSAASRAVKMTAQLIGVPLKIVNVDLASGEQFKEAYIKTNPFHTVPSIDDEGFILYESKAIMTYLINQYALESLLYPKAPKERALVEQMLHLDTGTCYPSFAAIMMSQMRYGVSPTQESLDKVKVILDDLDTILSERRYLAGQMLTLADISFCTTVSILDMGLYDLSGFINISEYLSRIREELSPMFEEICDEPVTALRNIVKQKMGLYDS